MKNILLLLISLFYGLQSFAQDPELYKTWYLREVFNDLNTVVVQNISPPINPILTISETLSFNGEAACNTFSGTMSFDIATNRLEMLSFIKTNNTCNEPAHVNFETEFFPFFEIGNSFQAFVSNETNGQQTLATIGPWYPHLVLKNYVLNVAKKDKLVIAVYPNPVADILFINPEGSTIDNINIYSLQGKLVLSENYALETIDVSDLSEGLYFIEISSSEGKSIQKFVKN
ncbi:MAG: heat shock protein HslJ [Sediminicola sp.]|jgi:heat shock protein HslJ|tara:strand:+ start:3566 stop:4255 length:690 start_codon:yes stop_codon:yes gene_type:complete